MLKSKRIIKKWAEEIVRCERILSSRLSTLKQKEQAEWKIEAIMELYSSDMEATFLLVEYLEKILF